MVNLPKGVSCDQCRYLSVSESLGLEVSTRIFTPGLSLAFGSQELEFLNVNSESFGCRKRT